MAVSTRNPKRDFTLLNPMAQQRLQERVAAAGGDVALVAQEIQVRLDQLEQADGTESPTVERAYVRAQLEYLDRLRQDQLQQQQPEPAPGGWWSRLNRVWRRNAPEAHSQR